MDGTFIGAIVWSSKIQSSSTGMTVSPSSQVSTSSFIPAEALIQYMRFYEHIGPIITMHRISVSYSSLFPVKISIYLTPLIRHSGISVGSLGEFAGVFDIVENVTST